MKGGDVDGDETDRPKRDVRRHTYVYVTLRGSKQTESFGGTGLGC